MNVSRRLRFASLNLRRSGSQWADAATAKLINGSWARVFSSEVPQQEVTLYQYAICPYCNIAKSLLHYGRFPYKAVEVNPLTKAELAEFSKDYRKVPIMTVSSDDQDSVKQLNGSEEIVDFFIDNHLNKDKVDATSESAKRWTHFAREDLAPLLYPNMCNTLGNSYRAFDYVHSVNSFTMLQRYSIQYLGSLAMYMAASKIKKKRDITDERAALMEALEELNTGLSSSQQFLSLDEKPHLGDLSVYGVLRGLQDLEVFDLVVEAYPLIQTWFTKMEETVDRKQ